MSSSNNNNTGEFGDDPRFDGLYMNVAQTAHGIEPLLDTVFGFLRRKTDFFAGPPGASDGTAAAMAKVTEVLQKHADRYQKEHQSAKKSKHSQTATKPPKKSAQRSSVVEQPFKNKSKAEDDDDDDDGIIEMEASGDFDISKNTAPTTKPIIKSLSEQDNIIASIASGTKMSPSTTGTASESTTNDAIAKEEGDSKKAVGDGDNKDEDDDDDDDDGGPPPVGNGGTVPGKYAWTQTLAEVVVTVPVPDHTRGRDLQVTIGRSHLKVVLKASSSTITEKTVLVDADLTKTVIMDDSFWTVEDGNRLVINLQKLNQMEWWDSVCKGDPTINVRKINPENSSLSDLDGETRKTVEKMMFDQRQKALGLPTSDEQSKLDVLENFKRQHPEMDFSNAKIS